MTNAIMVIAGSTPMVKLIYACSSMRAAIMVEAKSIYIRILVSHIMEVVSRVIPDKN